MGALKVVTILKKLGVRLFALLSKDGIDALRQAADMIIMPLCRRFFFERHAPVYKAAAKAQYERQLGAHNQRQLDRTAALKMEPLVVKQL